MIIRRTYISVLLSIAILIVSAQDSINITDNLVIVFAGDIMGHDTQIKGAYVDSLGTYNYEPTFRYIKDYISSSDIAVANLEVTLAGKPFKGYPQFSSPDELAFAAKDAGFDIMLTANNHALDRGGEGLERTLIMLDSLNFARIGTYKDSADRNAICPLIVEKNNIRIAFLNYTYGTNGLVVQEPYLINRINKDQITRDIDKAKSADSDYIICTIHWGKEYERTENLAQNELAEYIIAQGAHAIIGSHPHVVQPVEYIMSVSSDTSLKCPVFYSLGNFVSNQRAQYKDGGIVAELHISMIDSVVNLDSIAYLPYWVYREDNSEKSTFYVVPVAKYEADSTLIDFSEDDLWKFNRFQSDTRSHLNIKESNFYIRDVKPMKVQQDSIQ